MIKFDIDRDPINAEWLRPWIKEEAKEFLKIKALVKRVVSNIM